MYDKSEARRHMVEIVIDGKPVGKKAPLHGKGFTYTPAKTRAFEAHGRMAAQIAMAGKSPTSEPVHVDVWAILPIPSSWSQKRRRQAALGFIRPTTKPDVDNYAKSALDACNGIVFEDDRQVDVLSVTKAYGSDPKLIIKVWHP